MAYGSVTGIAPQYEDFPNYWLKFYAQGTTTPISMATDATGSTLISRAELDQQGFIVTAGEARFIPWVNAAYDAWLFPTAQEADNNDTTNAIQLADNQTSSAISARSKADAASFQDLQDGDWTGFDNVTSLSFELLIPYIAKGGADWYRDGTAGTPSTADLANSKFFDSTGAGFTLDPDQENNAYMFGAQGIGVSDDTAAIQMALDTGKTVNLLSGRYRITDQLKTSGLEGQNIIGNRAFLVNEVPLANGSVLLIRQNSQPFPAGRNNTYSGFKIQDFTGVSAVGIVLDEAAAWNYFEDIEIWSCASGIEFTKFNIGNVFHKCTFKANRFRGVLDPIHASSAEESVACVFSACNIEQSPVCMELNSQEIFVTSACVIEAYTVAGITSSKLVAVTNCYIESTGDNAKGISLTTGANQCIITGNTILQSAGENCVGVSYTGLSHYIAGNQFGGSGAGSFDIQNSTATNSASVIVGNGASNGVSLVGDTNTTFIQGANATFNQILLTSFGQFGSTATTMRGNFETTGDLEFDFGTTANKFNNIWCGQLIPVRIGFNGSVTAASTNNNSLFVDSADSKLKFKDSVGTVNALY